MSKTSKTIYFYNINRRYGAFNNFFDSPIEFEGRVYPTSEHAYQAAKFIYPGAAAESLAYGELIRSQDSPAKAFHLGRQSAKPERNYPWLVELRERISEHPLAVPRPDWDQVKVDVMRQILKCKFSQHPPLMEMLLSTGNAPIVENSASDYFWGNGKDGSGQNMLGKLLENLRDLPETPVSGAQVQV